MATRSTCSRQSAFGAAPRAPRAQKASGRRRAGPRRSPHRRAAPCAWQFPPAPIPRRGPFPALRDGFPRDRFAPIAMPGSAGEGILPPESPRAPPPEFRPPKHVTMREPLIPCRAPNERSDVLNARNRNGRPWPLSRYRIKVGRSVANASACRTSRCARIASEKFIATYATVVPGVLSVTIPSFFARATTISGVSELIFPQYRLCLFGVQGPEPQGPV